MAIEMMKEYEGRWTIYNTTNGESASIIKIGEYSLLPTTTKYRVDVKGKTVASMLEHFQTARSFATKAVKGELGTN